METQSEAAHRGPAEPPTFARSNEETKTVDDLATYFRKYARERPQTVALICLGIGFILGWKLKPW